jgi:hypothetical protein
MKISNIQFLQAIFGKQYQQAHVTSFIEDPSNIPTGSSGRCWAGGAYKDIQLIPDSNQFYTVSLFKPDEQSKPNRRKANFIACYTIALDDVKEKLPIEQVERLPPPSIVLKSSLFSEQWLYLLTEPCTDASKIDNLHDGLISNGLAPDGKDPGQKGITRYLRLPEGCNTKAKRIIENGGTAPICEVVEWYPDRRYTLKQLAEPFVVDLDAPRADKRVDGATTVSDHPLLHTDAINIKKGISPGRFDITCPWVNGHTGGADNGSAVFTNTDGTLGFKCHHGSCESLTGADLLKLIETIDAGFNQRLKQWQTMRAFSEVQQPLLKTESPLELLISKCANGDSISLRSQMMSDKFILKELAIQGQWTVLYAGPNTGKTLLTLWMLKESVSDGELDGSKVFYANCDDTHRGNLQKLEIAEQHGFNMLLPNIKGFKPDTLVATMAGLAEKNEARGVVILLDTLKKFTDLMDKRVASQFGNVAREFVSAGGTLICLAHVNKHKSAEGKSIYTGTADIRDDADCVYTIEHLGKTGETHTVEFECIKSRGAVADKMTFQYSKGDGYIGLFNSVKRLTHDDAQIAQHAVEEAEQHKLDAEVIEAVKTALTNSVCVKGEIVKFTMETFDVSRRGVHHVLDKYEGRLWTAEKGEKNTSIYKMVEAPPPPMSFM